MSAAYNEFTGDSIVSKKQTAEFEANFDAIFRKPKKPADDWNESKIDEIGQNGEAILNSELTP